jgi:hypothetical protein
MNPSVLVTASLSDLFAGCRVVFAPRQYIRDTQRLFSMNADVTLRTLFRDWRQYQPLRLEALSQSQKLFAPMSISVDATPAMGRDWRRCVRALSYLTPPATQAPS